MSSFRSLAAAGIVLLLALAGCVVQPAPQPRPVVEVIAPRAPPPVRYEVAPPVPQQRAELVVWDPGHWHWDGRDWDWVPGHYVERPHREAHWEPGHWAERPNGAWLWVEGHWR